jgi:hypothetical protein
MFKKRPLLLGIFLILFAGVQLITNMYVPWFQALRTVDVIRLTGIGFCFGAGLMLVMHQLFRD